MPDKNLIEQFLGEVTVMVFYPGFGDQNYAPFQSACEKLLPFHNSNDLDGFKEQIATIRTLKTQCHNQFK